MCNQAENSEAASNSSVRICLGWPSMASRILVKKLNFLAMLLQPRTCSRSSSIFISACHQCFHIQQRMRTQGGADVPCVSCVFWTRLTLLHAAVSVPISSQRRSGPESGRLHSISSSSASSSLRPLQHTLG